MKKKIIVSFVITLSIILLGWSIRYLNLVQQETKANQETIDQLVQDNEDKTNSISSLEEENEVLKEEVNSNVQEKEKLKKEIDDMMKSVSLNTQNVSQPSGATLYHMKKTLKGTTMYDLSESFIEAEQTYGVNAFFLAGIVALESSWATSNRATNGSNNLTGFAVYSDSSRGAMFNSKNESIMTTAKFLKENYLTKGGEHYKGFSIASVNVKYSESPLWKNQVAEIGVDLLSKANNNK